MEKGRAALAHHRSCIQVVFQLLDVVLEFLDFWLTGIQSILLNLSCSKNINRLRLSWLTCRWRGYIEINHLLILKSRKYNLHLHTVGMTIILQPYLVERISGRNVWFTRSGEEIPDLQLLVNLDLWNLEWNINHEAFFF